MAAQLVHPQAAVKIEEPLEPFMKEAGDIAVQFLSLRLRSTEAAISTTKAPHPTKDAKGADFTAASGPPPPPTQNHSQIIAQRLITIGDSIDRDLVSEEIRAQLQKLVSVGIFSAFSVSPEPFVSTCRDVMRKFSNKFQTGWQQIVFVYDAMSILVEIVRREAGGNSTQTTELQIANFIGQALSELGLYRWLTGHGGWEHFGDALQEADSKVDMVGTSVDPEN